MNNIHNFANRQLCEYASIFPTVAALLDHLLFTNGTGYEFDEACGMIYNDGNNGPEYINQYAQLSDAEWDTLIAKCYQKQIDFAHRFGHGRPVDMVEVAEDCKIYKKQNISDEDFSEESLFNDLMKIAKKKSTRHYDSFVRPYPLSPGYAEIYNLNENTPEWLIKIAVNFCNAWVRFLDEELRIGNVWIQPSLRPATEESKLMAAELDKIMDDESISAYVANYKEPTRDYADAEYTTMHRNMLAEIAQKLQQK
jgi:hypothetical protein